jgi:hypothetical protein
MLTAEVKVESSQVFRIYFSIQHSAFSIQNL